MTFRVLPLLPLMSASLLLVLAGCMPPPASPGDEEKEPYFRKAEELAASQDIPGAIDAFEKTLEVNPHNSLAHYRLGLLHEKTDPAIALYHFGQFRKRTHDQSLVERAREREAACRTALAQSVATTMAPGADRLQKEIERWQKEAERLSITNRELYARVEGWEQWAARTRLQQQSSQDSPRTTEPVEPATGAAARNPARTVEPAREPATGARTPPPGPPPSSTRVHRVRSGETPSSIAKSYKIPLSSLMRANPRLEARRMRAGDSILIPAR